MSLCVYSKLNYLLNLLYSILNIYIENILGVHSFVDVTKVNVYFESAHFEYKNINIERNAIRSVATYTV